MITVKFISSLTTGCWVRQGEAAARIWDAIYTQSCFANIHANDTCTERRIFYRLVSGKQMQAAAWLQVHMLCAGQEVCVSASVLLINCIFPLGYFCFIAGMHASISAHISNDYLLDEFRGQWGPNLGEFERRLGNPEVRLAEHAIELPAASSHVPIGNARDCC